VKAHALLRKTIHIAALFRLILKNLHVVIEISGQRRIWQHLE